ncbi:MAG: hypothetical protein QXF56_01480 [Candidatus Micrarchaeia archaeon]
MRKLLLLLICLLFLGCVSYKPPEEKPPANETVQPPVEIACEDITNKDEADRCYYNNAIMKNNLTACSFIFSDSLRDNCNLRFAIQLNDSTLCMRIIKDETRDNCYHTLAPVMGIATCNKIENQTLRKQCRLELGDDTVLCEELTDEFNFSLCMAKARDNPSTCSEIKNSSLVDSCYFEYAKSKDDYSACNLLSSSGVRDECFQHFATLHSNSSLCRYISFNYTKYLCLTKITGNSSLCNELPDYLQRDSCIEVFATDKLNHSLCQEISTNFYKDRCYTNIAVKTLNPNICSYIICYECITDRDNCYHTLANVTLNISLCSKISDPFRKDTCNLDIAKKARNPSFCSAIENTYTRNTCYSSIIYNEKYDVSACDTIIHQNWKDECYKQLAITTGNSTICDKITDSFVKNSCKKSL